MIALAGAAALWVAVHAGIAGTAARTWLVARIGQTGFLIGFSIASIGAIALLVASWKDAPVVEMWFAPDWLHWVVVAAMLPAFILFIGSVSVRSPTAVGGKVGATGPTAMLRVTRHPMLWSFAIWGVAHILANGDVASLLLFGAFVVTALVGMPSIDSKVAARDGAGWARFSAATSIVPFGAIAAGRNRLMLAELQWAILGGVLAWAAMLYAHPYAIGVPALPG